jgi:hypothetical protein
MTDWVWPTLGLTAVVSAASLVLGLLLARRYRELHAALVSTGVLSTRRAARNVPPSGAWLPAPGTAVPDGLLAVTTDGSVLTSEEFAGPDVVMAFLGASCPPCRAALPELRAVLGGQPAGRPRPIAVLHGPAGECAEYEAALTGVARVVRDGDEKLGGLTNALAVRSYPAVLVVGGGVVRKAGMTMRDVELTRT